MSYSWTPRYIKHYCSCKSVTVFITVVVSFALRGSGPHLPRMRYSPVSPHSRELRASKLELSNSFIAVCEKKKQHKVMCYCYMSSTCLPHHAKYCFFIYINKSIYSSTVQIWGTRTTLEYFHFMLLSTSLRLRGEIFRAATIKSISCQVLN